MAKHRAPRRRASVASLCVAVLSLAMASVVLFVAPQSAAAATRSQALTSAYAYGHDRGYHVGIAVLDTRTGRTYHAGDHTGTFASESVVKVMIATRVYLQGRLHGATAKRMYTMITRSDDKIASSTYGSVGGDHLITYIKQHFHLPTLGSEPRRAGWWGNTHITADGMVALYAKLKKMPHFGSWLLDAMHHATKHGSDGFYQWFGLKSANSHAAIKQGWGTDYDNWSAGADENTTGFVDGDRYAIAILARGPAKTYGKSIGAMLTATAKRLLPGGAFPSDAPVLSTVGTTTGSTAGGAVITVRGANLANTSAVYFGTVKATGVHHVSGQTLSVRVPPHAAGETRIRAVTPLGSSGTHGPTFTFVAPPTVTSVSPSPSAAGSTVTIAGTGFVGSHLTVSFGPATATVTSASPTSVQVVVPAGTAGATVDVRVSGTYGISALSSQDSFTYG